MIISFYFLFAKNLYAPVPHHRNLLLYKIKNKFLQTLLATVERAASQLTEPGQLEDLVHRMELTAPNLTSTGICTCPGQLVASTCT